MPSVSLPVTKTVFPNGLQLLVSPNSTIPAVSIAAYCDAGVLCEPESKAGLSNLVSLLLDEGSFKRSGEAIVEELDAVGGHFDAGPSGASLVVPSQEFELGLRILAEVLLQPAFPEKALRKKKEWVISEILADEDDPKTKAIQSFREEIYGRHPLHRPASGYPATVSKLKRKDLVEYHQNFYAPERVMLGICGDISPERARKLVEKYFGRWNHRAAAKPNFPSIPKPSKPNVKIIRTAHEQVNVFFGHVGIRRTDPDYYSLLVMDHVLGTGPGFTDRLSKKLRDEQGLAYTVYGGMTSSSGKEPGLFSVYIGTSPDRFQQAVRGIFQEVRRLVQEKPTAEEMLLAKDYLTGSYVFGLERNLGRALFLINKERYQLGDDYLERYPKLLEAVTGEDILRACKKHIFPDAYNLVAVGAVEWKR